jgi:hypothetical protein
MAEYHSVVGSQLDNWWSPDCHSSSRFALSCSEFQLRAMREFSGAMGLSLDPVSQPSAGSRTARWKLIGPQFPGSFSDRHAVVPERHLRPFSPNRDAVHTWESRVLLDQCLVCDGCDRWSKVRAAEQCTDRYQKHWP